MIQRLNDALEGMWSFEIINHHINEKEGEVLVIGKLTVGNIYFERSWNAIIGCMLK